MKMNKEKLDQFMDQLLDAGLTRLRSEHPRPGLPDRVLVNLRAEQRPAFELRWPWLLATAAALTVVVAGVFLTWHRVPSSSVPVAVSSKAATPEIPQLPQPGGTEHPSIASVKPATPAPQTTLLQHEPVERQMVRGPMKAVFPSPMPLSKEEQLLVSLASLPQQPDLKALAAHEGEDGYLRIDPLNIPPLEEEGGNPKSEFQR
jgi:hypothetical protein